jgi:hypothetical protein
VDGANLRIVMQSTDKARGATIASDFQDEETQRERDPPRQLA